MQDVTFNGIKSKEKKERSNKDGRNFTYFLVFCFDASLQSSGCVVESLAVIIVKKIRFLLRLDFANLASMLTLCLICRLSCVQLYGADLLSSC